MKFIGLDRLSFCPAQIDAMLYPTTGAIARQRPRAGKDAGRASSADSSGDGRRTRRRASVIDLGANQQSLAEQAQVQRAAAPAALPLRRPRAGGLGGRGGRRLSPVAGGSPLSSCGDVAPLCVTCAQAYLDAGRREAALQRRRREEQQKGGGSSSTGGGGGGSGAAAKATAAQRPPTKSERQLRRCCRGAAQCVGLALFGAACATLLATLLHALVVDVLEPALARIDPIFRVLEYRSLEL